MTILKNLRYPKYFLFALGTAFIAFDLLLYLMYSLPGSRDEMCIAGANLTADNIAFSIFLSVLIGVLIAGFIALFDKKVQDKKNIAMGSLSGIGAGVGVMTVFCTVCTLPVISLFGLSVSLEFFSYNNYYFKVISLSLIVLAIYQLNKQLNGKCVTCVYEPT
jgi:hypothetical protein